MSIEPLSNYILVEPKVADEKTENGIYVPNTLDPSVKTTEGVITMIGEVYDEIKYAVGDKVVFPTHAGVGIIHDGVTYRVMKEVDLLVVIK